MKFFALAFIACATSNQLEQDPCAGCDDDLAYNYQVCAKNHGDPCQEMAGGVITSGQGTKKDVGCCMKAEKHRRCLKCASADCEFKTCNVNKKYYRTYDKGKEQFPDTVHNKAMKAAGWSK